MGPRRRPQPRRRLGPARRAASIYSSRNRPRPSSSVACATSPSPRWRRFSFRSSSEVIFAPIHSPRAARWPICAAAAAAPPDAGQSSAWLGSQRPCNGPAERARGRRGGRLRLRLSGRRSASRCWPRSLSRRPRRMSRARTRQRPNPPALGAIAGAPTSSRCRSSPWSPSSAAPLAARFALRKSGHVQHRIARIWARGCVSISGSAHRHRRRESAQAPRRRLRLQPHLLYGYAGHLRRAALPVPHPGQEGALAHPLHRLVSESLRPVPIDTATPAPRSPAWE